MTGPDTRRPTAGGEFFDEVFADLQLDGKIARAGAEVDWILGRLGVPTGAAATGVRSLDLGCGRGRTVLGFAERGAAACGVDLNAAYVRTARERARARGLGCRFLTADVRDVRVHLGTAAFDVVTSLFTSFGYFDDGTNARLVADVHRLLAPGGVFVLETQNVESPAVRRDRRAEVAGPGAATVVKAASFDPATRCTTFRHEVRGDRPRTAVLVVRLYRRDELAELARAAGFAGTDFHGRLDGLPYDPDGDKLVMVARRGGDA